MTKFTKDDLVLHDSAGLCRVTGSPAGEPSSYTFEVVEGSDRMDGTATADVLTEPARLQLQAYGVLDEVREGDHATVMDPTDIHPVEKTTSAEVWLGEPDFPLAREDVRHATPFELYAEAFISHLPAKNPTPCCGAVAEGGECAFCGSDVESEASDDTSTDRRSDCCNALTRPSTSPDISGEGRYLICIHCDEVCGRVVEEHGEAKTSDDHPDYSQYRLLDGGVVELVSEGHYCAHSLIRYLDDEGGGAQARTDDLEEPSRLHLQLAGPDDEPGGLLERGDIRVDDYVIWQGCGPKNEVEKVEEVRPDEGDIKGEMGAVGDANTYRLATPAELRDAGVEPPTGEAGDLVSNCCGADTALRETVDPGDLRRYCCEECGEPCERVEVVDDPLHPTGECTCNGEGRCRWCNMICGYCGTKRVTGCGCEMPDDPRPDGDVSIPVDAEETDGGQSDCCGAQPWITKEGQIYCGDCGETCVALTGNPDGTATIVDCTECGDRLHQMDTLEAHDGRVCMTCAGKRLMVGTDEPDPDDHPGAALGAIRRLKKALDSAHGGGYAHAAAVGYAACALLDDAADETFDDTEPSNLRGLQRREMVDASQVGDRDTTTINWRDPDTEPDEGEIIVIETSADAATGLHTGRVRYSNIDTETGEHVTEVWATDAVYRWCIVDRWALWSEDVEVTQ